MELTLSLETRTLAKLLMEVPIGETITYGRMSEELGFDITDHSKRHFLTSARRVVLREHGAAFTADIKVGMRRLQPDEAPNIGTWARGKIRRASTTAMKAMQMVAAKTNGLAPETQRRLAAEMAVHGVIAEVAKPKVINKMPEEIPTLTPKAISAGLKNIFGITE